VIAIVEVALLILDSALLLLKMAIYFFLRFIDSSKELYAAALHAFTTRSTETQTRRSVVTPKMIKPDRYCATKPAINDEFSTPSGDDLNQQSCLPLMAKDDDQNLTALENERLENELSLLQSKLTDSSSKLLQYQNVQDESATTKSELEEKKREITDSKEKNLRLTNDDSQLRREIEDRERLIASSQADMEELRVTLNNQTDTNEKLLDQMSSLTPRNGEEVGIKVEKPNEMPVIKQFETIQNNPESLNFPTWEAILTIESLSDEIPTENQELDEAPEEPVSEPKDIPVKVRPSNQQLEMDEKKPEQEILLEIIDDTGNMTNKDPVLGETKRTELLEMAEETIIPEESEHVEKQPTNAQSNKSTDNQFLHKPGDGQVQPQIPEKSQLLQNRAMDEKPEATELFFDCKEENQTAYYCTFHNNVKG
jgi:hypothetical protein